MSILNRNKDKGGDTAKPQKSETVKPASAASDRPAPAGDAEPHLKTAEAESPAAPDDPDAEVQGSEDPRPVSLVPPSVSGDRGAVTEDDLGREPLRDAEGRPRGAHDALRDPDDDSVVTLGSLPVEKRPESNFELTEEAKQNLRVMHQLPDGMSDDDRPDRPVPLPSRREIVARRNNERGEE